MRQAGRRSRPSAPRSASPPRTRSRTRRARTPDGARSSLRPRRTGRRPPARRAARANPSHRAGRTSSPSSRTDRLPSRSTAPRRACRAADVRTSPRDAPAPRGPGRRARASAQRRTAREERRQHGGRVGASAAGGPPQGRVERAVEEGQVVRPPGLVEHEDGLRRGTRAEPVDRVLRRRRQRRLERHVARLKDRERQRDDDAVRLETLVVAHHRDAVIAPLDPPHGRVETDVEAGRHRVHQRRVALDDAERDVRAVALVRRLAQTADSRSRPGRRSGTARTRCSRARAVRTWARRGRSSPSASTRPTATGPRRRRPPRPPPRTASSRSAGCSGSDT